MKIRYAEVLLNYAEAACGLAYAKGGDNAFAERSGRPVKLIRQRVGYTGDCGLQANLESDPAACMSAILYERQIELAYEGSVLTIAVVGCCMMVTEWAEDFTQMICLLHGN